MENFDENKNGMPENNVDEQNVERHYQSYDDYDPYGYYSWEDSIMDALDDDPEAYWNID